MHRPSDRDVNWMSPVQGKSTPVQVKKPYGNFDMVTCRLSSCNPECTKYTCRYYSKEGLAVYRERKKEKKEKKFSLVHEGLNHNAVNTLWPGIRGEISQSILLRL